MKAVAIDATTESLDIGRTERLFNLSAVNWAAAPDGQSDPEGRPHRRTSYLSWFKPRNSSRP